MPAVPCSTNTISNLDALNTIADGNNVTDDFVTWNARTTNDD